MIQYWYEKHRELKERRDEEGFDGFTLIELLIVIVVLGILAATVIFALGGVTGQSTSAACNSDAKTAEVAVQAYIASPDNSGNSKPTNISQLYQAPFGSPADTFMTKQSNTNYTVALGGDITGKSGDGVWVHAGQVDMSAPPVAAAGWALYDDPTGATANPCNTNPIT